MDIQAFTQSLPQKRMASGALILNSEGKVLLVNPTYRDKWLIPGGMVEQNESPLEACKRELLEELGLIYQGDNRLLVLDYVPRSDEGTEALHFIFNGGKISDRDIARITLDCDELSEWRFVDAEVLDEYLPIALCRRMKQAYTVLMNNKETRYIELGTPL